MLSRCSALGRASLTTIVRPPEFDPFKPTIALAASSSFAISTNPKAAPHLIVSFGTSSQRVFEDTVWDVVDYHFTVTRGNESCEIAVGIPGDWLDRMSPPLLRKLAETWLMHRLEHGYEPFGEPLRCRRLMQAPFSIADYWYLHGRFPH